MTPWPYVGGEGEREAPEIVGQWLSQQAIYGGSILPRLVTDSLRTESVLIVTVWSKFSKCYKKIAHTSYDFISILS